MIYGFLGMYKLGKCERYLPRFHLFWGQNLDVLYATLNEDIMKIKLLIASVALIPALVLAQGFESTGKSAQPAGQTMPPNQNTQSQVKPQNPNPANAALGASGKNVGSGSSTKSTGDSGHYNPANCQKGVTC